jgi:hypothetical protein
MGDVCWYNENSLRRNTPDFKVALLISGTQSAARWRMAGDGNYGSTGKWTIKKASQYSLSNTGSTNLLSSKQARDTTTHTLSCLKFYNNSDLKCKDDDLTDHRSSSTNGSTGFLTTREAHQAQRKHDR